MLRSEAGLPVGGSGRHRTRGKFSEDETKSNPGISGLGGTKYPLDCF